MLTDRYFRLEALAPIINLFSKSRNPVWGSHPTKQVLSRLLASFVEAIGRNRCGLVHLLLMTRARGNVSIRWMWKGSWYMFLAGNEEKAAKSAVKKFTNYPSESCVSNKLRLGNAPGLRHVN